MNSIPPQGEPMNIEQTKYYIQKYQLSLSKSLGQNFLIDDGKLKEIIDQAELTREDLVIEIGPGIGTLSIEAAKKCGRLILVEIDSRLIPVLEEQFANNPNVEILHKDALEVDFKELCDARLERFPELKNIKVIANLPYYITTPLMTSLLLSLPNSAKMVFTIQKEAADRIVSGTRKKEYGILSVLAQFYSDPRITGLLAPECFFPQPTVVSAILVMPRRDPFPTDSTQKESMRFFYRVVQASFSQRRKTLLNSLGGSGMVPGGKNALGEILLSEGISIKSRAEELDYLQFLAIAKKLEM